METIDGDYLDILFDVQYIMEGLDWNYDRSFYEFYDPNIGPEYFPADMDDDDPPLEEFLNNKLSFIEWQMGFGRYDNQVDLDGLASRLMHVLQRFEYFRDGLVSFVEISRCRGFEEELGEIITLADYEVLNILKSCWSYWDGEIVDIGQGSTFHDVFWWVYDRIGCTDLAMVLTGPDHLRTFERVDHIVRNMTEQEYFFHEIQGRRHYELFLESRGIVGAIAYRGFENGFFADILLDRSLMHWCLNAERLLILERLTRPAHGTNHLELRSLQMVRDSGGDEINSIFFQIVCGVEYSLDVLYTMTNDLLLFSLLGYIRDFQSNRET